MSETSIACTRIFTGDDGRSHFEDLAIPLHSSERGLMSAPLELGAATMFRATPPGGNLGFHVAPRRQFVIHLAGGVEIEIGDGTTRQFGVGDVLLADDTTGEGHISRDVETPRRQIFVPLSDDVDLGPWRATT